MLLFEVPVRGAVLLLLLLNLALAYRLRLAIAVHHGDSLLELLLLLLLLRLMVQVVACGRLVRNIVMHPMEPNLILNLLALLLRHPAKLNRIPRHSEGHALL